MTRDTERAPKWSPSILPIVEVTANLAKVRDEAIKHLAKLGGVYRRDGVLVDMPGDTVREIPDGELRVKLTSACVFRETVRGVEHDVTPSYEILSAVKAKGSWPELPELAHMQSWPILRRDGSLFAAPGYDAATRTIYAPAPGAAPIIVKAAPTKAEALAAAQRLLTFIAKNRFCDDDAQARACWLGLVLTLAGRSAFDGSPAYGFDGPEVQLGKTALVKLAYGLVTGKSLDVATYYSTVEEQQKNMPLWAEDPLVLFDNLTGAFGSEVFDAALTTGKAKCRVLGATKRVVADCSRTTWAFTGSNLGTASDAPTRCIMIRLDYPSTEGNWVVELDNGAWTEKHRATAVADALTILTTYQQHAKAHGAAPIPKSARADCRYPGWDAVVRRAVLWLGLGDPFGQLQVASDTKTAGIQAALELLHARFGTAEFKAGSIPTDFGQISGETDKQHRARIELIKALGDVYGKRIDSPIKMGFALGKLRGKRLARYALAQTTVDGSTSYYFASNSAK